MKKFLWALVALIMGMGVMIGSAGSASAHTPSGGADCKGVWGKGVNYDWHDTNTIVIKIDGIATTQLFGDNGYLLVPVPQDGIEHTWSWSVNTTNPNPAYKASNAGKIKCGMTPQPKDEEEFRVVQDAPNCDNNTVVTRTERRSRAYWNVNGVWTTANSPWSQWFTVDMTYRDATAAECPPPPVVTPPKQITPPVPPAPPVPPKHVKHPHKLAPHVTVIDLCRCKHDKVLVASRHLAFKSIHQVKNVFTIRLVAARGYLLPVDYKHPSKGYAHSVKYVVKTTNTKCACPPHRHCVRPQPKPVCPARCP